MILDDKFIKKYEKLCDFVKKVHDLENLCYNKKSILKNSLFKEDYWSNISSCGCS